MQPLLGMGASHSPGCLPGPRPAARRLPAGVPAWARPLLGPCRAGGDPSQGGSSVLVLGVLATLGAHGGARTPRRRGSRSAAPDCTVSFLRPPSFASRLRKPLLNSPRGGKQGEGKPLTWEAAPPGGALASPGISNASRAPPRLPPPTRSPAASRPCLLESHFLARETLSRVFTSRSNGVRRAGA